MPRLGFRDSLAEWSKALDLKPNGVTRVSRSNPPVRPQTSGRVVLLSNLTAVVKNYFLLPLFSYDPLNPMRTPPTAVHFKAQVFSWFIKPKARRPHGAWDQKGAMGQVGYPLFSQSIQATNTQQTTPPINSHPPLAVRGCCLSIPSRLGSIWVDLVVGLSNPIMGQGRAAREASDDVGEPLLAWTALPGRL